MTRHFVAGAQFDDDALAVDTIAAVGPGGEFLSHDHTQRHWRELWVPRFFDRQRLDKWRDAGSPLLNDRLRAATIELMDNHRPPPLPAAAESEIAAILRDDASGEP